VGRSCDGAGRMRTARAGDVESAVGDDELTEGVGCNDDEGPEHWQEGSGAQSGLPTEEHGKGDTTKRPTQSHGLAQRTAQSREGRQREGRRTVAETRGSIGATRALPRPRMFFGCRCSLEQTRRVALRCQDRPDSRANADAVQLCLSAAR
jgi:hypothetical protein